jgi:hypothetical protein
VELAGQRFDLMIFVGVDRRNLEISSSERLVLGRREGVSKHELDNN